MSGFYGTLKRAQRAPVKQQLWQAMRVLRQFDCGQLATTTTPPCSVVLATQYVRRLALCGFLRCTHARRRGQAGSRNQYVLVRDSGPVAPIQRWAKVAMHDPNTGITWGEGGADITETETPPHPRGMRPLTTMQVRALAALAQGRTIADSLEPPANPGVVSTLRRSLIVRGLTVQGDELTDLGRREATRRALP